MTHNEIWLVVESVLTFFYGEALEHGDIGIVLAFKDCPQIRHYKIPLIYSCNRFFVFHLRFLFSPSFDNTISFLVFFF